ncbi:MAG: hypothetical protein B6D59_01800 [Campylobacteraceae bacterium 4484_4]|nr:MAG: hypothetical protein B6D59_01800 [Campylobacteraceae bacterium 4484_4]
MKHRINFLTSHFLPENTAGTNRVLSFVKVLERSYFVQLFALTERGKPQSKDKVEFTENIDVYYINQKEYNAEKFFARALWEIIYSFKLVRKAARMDHRLSIATAPYMFIIPILAMIGKEKKVIDIRDLVWEYIDEDSKFKKLIKLTIRKLMEASISQYDYVVVTNRYEEEWIKTHTKQKSIERISNGIELNKFEELSHIEIDPDVPFTVTYVGNIGIAQNIKILIEVAKELKDVRFQIIGGGNKYEELVEYTKANHLSNVKFFGKLHRDEILSFYKQSSVLYAQLDEKFKSAMPSKLYEYASTGLPIIYGGIGEAKEFVDRLENCITVPPNDIEALKKAILEYKDGDREIKISEKNREIIKKQFIRDYQSKKIVDIADRLIQKEEK